MVYIYCTRCSERWFGVGRDVCPKCGAGQPYFEVSLASGFERPPEEIISARAMYWIVVNWWRRLRRFLRL